MMSLFYVYFMFILTMYSDFENFEKRYMNKMYYYYCICMVKLVDYYGVLFLTMVNQ